MIDYLAILKALAPRVPPQRQRRQTEIIEAIAPVMERVLGSYQINTKLRIAHFLAQVAHECAGFSTTEEFADGRAYEGRAGLGNVNPGDGPRYKGRGLIQLTGRFNYGKYGKLLGMDLENHPKLASDPATSLRIACLYWSQNNLNSLADRDNIVGITQRINGGQNGIDDRRRYLAKAKVLLSSAPETVVTTSAVAAAPVAATAAHKSGWSTGEIVAVGALCLVIAIALFFIVRAIRRSRTDFTPTQQVP